VDGETEAVHELRRAYHDRIADLREQSFTVLRTAIEAASRGTASLLGESPADLGSVNAASVDMAGTVAAIDSEVVALLALEAPVARDLRLILAARDVGQIGLLCVGLGVTLASRSSCAATIESAGLRELVERAGRAAVDLLTGAEAAWRALAEDLADTVFTGLDQAREARNAFFAALLELEGVPIEVALDLGMAARVYDRLIDHAAEIAGRVGFAVSGHAREAAPAE
jgi:phosphate transport system protein